MQDYFPRARAIKWASVSVAFLVLSVGILAACALPPTLSEVRRNVRDERYEEALAKLEQLRERRPRNVRVRSALAELYFQLALRAIRQRADGEYFDYLQLALDEAVEMVALEPRMAEAHRAMGILTAYLGDPDRTLHHFHNAYHLGPDDWLNSFNLAEIYLFQGEISIGRHWLEKGRRLGAPPVAVEYGSLLAAWRTGDLGEAEDLFELLYELDPVFIKSRWEAAVEPQEIESLEDLARRCCACVVCGSYMTWLCREMGRDPRLLERTDEQREEMLRRELERQRRLRKIYERHKDIEIAIEVSDAEG